MEQYDPTKPYCSILRNIDRNFAWRINYACWQHDEDYELRRGSRIASDLRFIAKIAELSTWRALVYGPLILLFGWYLWYDVDKWVQRLYYSIINKFKRD